jgi:aldose 1-epimerase
VANFTNHSYFNLAGHDGGYIGGQKLKLYSAAFTPVTPTGSIPTGEIRPVKGTPFDFTDWKAIGTDINEEYDQLSYTGGYDHNFTLDNGGSLAIMAEALCEETGIHLTAYTDCPGVQFYSGNYITNQTGKSGVTYSKRCGFCLESQYYPDSINNPAFATPLLKAGETYQSQTIYRLSLDE